MSFSEVIRGLFATFGFFLPLPALVLLVVSIVRGIAGRKSFRTSLVIAAISAASFYVWDCFDFMFLPLSALLLLAVVVLCFLPATLMALGTDRRVATLRAAMGVIYLFAAIASFVTIGAQNRMADRRAVKLGDACLAYRAKYHHYPKTLDALAPEFISYVPVPRYSLLPSETFSYYSGAGQDEPMLWYVIIPPFGRRFYHIESRQWGFMD
jgi:hypothetical protein